MKLRTTLLALLAGCSAGDNLGDTPVLGQQHWTIALGGDSIDESAYNGIAFTAGGNVVVTGQYRGTVDFGTTTHTAQPDSVGDLFVTVRSVVDGSELWTRVIGASALGLGADVWLSTAGVAVDSAGDIVIAGSYGIDEDFGGVTLAGIAGSAFVAKYHEDGTLAWARALGPNSSLVPRAFAIGPDDHITLAGWVSSGNLTVQLPSHSTTCGNGDCPAWIVQLAADGSPVWDEFQPYAIGRIAALADGSFAISTAISQPATIAGTSIVAQSSATPVVIHLAADGTPDHAASYGDPQTRYDSIGLVEGASGVVALTNQHGGTDATEVPHLAGLDAHDEVEWNAQGVDGPATALGLAQAPDGTLLVGGMIGNYVADFGNGTVNGATFLASYAPSGELVDARTYGASGAAKGDQIQALAVSPGGAVAFAGMISDSLDFGTGPVTSHGDSDVVVGLIDPPAP